MHFKNRLFAIKKYMQAKVFIREAAVGFFFEYLMKCVSLHSEACIELLDIFTRLELSDKQMYYSRYFKNTTLLLIEAYNRTSLDSISKELAMDLFDSLLKKEECKNQIERILRENDRI